MYLEFGYPSLFEYLTKRMGYSNASAQRRIDAARLSKDVPKVLEHIESGEINLSQISMMAQATRDLAKNSEPASIETRERLVNEVLGKNLGQTEIIVSQTLNIPIKEGSKTKHQRDESVRLEVTLTKEQWEKFNQARDVVSNSLPNGSDWGNVIEYISELVISKKDKAAPRRARSSQFSSSEIKKTEVNTCVVEASNGRTHIPNSIQREVFTRDKCCQFQSKVTGHKCSSTWKLTLDHIKPVWAGGSNSADNLRVFCASHNLEAYRNQVGIRNV
jgi:5-methylcytosine-specific restriction endonuclease McrA